MMESYRYYNDLIEEMEILEYQIEICSKERMDWYFDGRLGSKVPMEVAAEKIDKLSERIEWLDERLSTKKEIRTNLEKRLSALGRLEYKVAYMRFIEKKSLDEIAEELDYSIDWIKKISSKVTRHLEGTDILQMG